MTGFFLLEDGGEEKGSSSSEDGYELVVPSTFGSGRSCECEV